MKSQPTLSKPNHHQQQGQPSQLTWVYSLGGRLRHLTHGGDLESPLTSFLSDNYFLESPDLAYSQTYNELEKKFEYKTNHTKEEPFYSKYFQVLFVSCGYGTCVWVCNIGCVLNIATNQQRTKERKRSKEHLNEVEEELSNWSTDRTRERQRCPARFSTWGKPSVCM